jgi:hypothetical protein
VGPIENIDSADAGVITDSSSEALLAELREKRRKFRCAPLAAVLGLIGLIAAAAWEWPAWLMVALFGAIVAGVVLAHRHDKLTKTVVIMYDFDSGTEEAVRSFCEWVTAVAASQRIWRIDAAGRVHDRKYHAGASTVISRSPATIREAPPPFVTTNVPIYYVTGAKTSLYFFPDRLLVYNGNHIGAVSYSSLNTQATVSRFIEDGSVPGDARVVDHTWRYVNKGGGPDRRFNNNRQLPICAYDELSLTTSSGLNEILQLSRSGVAEGFVSAVRRLAGAANG